MGYVESHLLPNEELKYRAHLHKIVFVWPTILALAGVAAAVGLVLVGAAPFAAIPVVVAAVPLLGTYITYTSSEFAVTDKRVVIKVGVVRRRMLKRPCEPEHGSAEFVVFRQAKSAVKGEPRIAAVGLNSRTVGPQPLAIDADCKHDR